jgi:hypothetical protein
MKKLLIVSFVLITAAGCFAGSQRSKGNTSLVPVDKVFDFGTIDLKDSVAHEFRLVNTGRERLLIKDVKASCECTKTGWTKEAVLPGDTAYIGVSFKPSQPGKNSKAVVVTANTDSVFTVLYLVGNVTDEAGHAKTH